MHCFFGLGERIRTSGLLNPIQTRYQAALHPETFVSRTKVIIVSQKEKVKHKLRDYDKFSEEKFVR